MRKSDQIKLAFESGGLFSSESSWQHSTRSITTCELIVVTKGEVYLQENGHEFVLQHGDYLFLYPDRVHGGTKISDMPVEFFWLHFKEDETRGACAPRPQDMPQHGTLSAHGEAVRLIRQLLHYSETPFFSKTCCDYTLSLLLWEIASQTIGAPISNALADQVHEYVRSHTDVQLCVKDVENHFGYNADYLSRVLKTHRGRTLQQDIIAERLDRAKLLLHTSNYTVETVARQLGYDDANLFVKFFRYHTHTTPTAYRNTYTKQVTNHR